MPHPSTTPLEIARKQLLSAATGWTPQQEICGVSNALGRVLATEQISSVDLPQTDNVAVDGYAVEAAFLAAHPDHLFKVAGTARAGHPFAGTAAPGEAVRVFTGAVMPEGSDCVIMHEDCQISEVGIICGKQLKSGTNMRPAGENIAAGETLAAKGVFLGAADIGQLAAAGLSQIPVFQPLKIALMSTGDELVQSGDSRKVGQVFDSNRPMVAALCHQQGAQLTDYGIIRDDQVRLTSAWQEALDHCDVIISSGGASDGVEDHTQAALKACEAECLFWRLAMKPGRPMAVGKKGHQFIFCLPGNPVAAFVCFRLLVRPVLDKLSGGRPRLPFSLMLSSGFSHKKPAGRAEFLRACLTETETGVQQVVLHGRKGAGVISSLTGADGLVEIPFATTEIASGQPVRFYPFHEVV